MNKPALISKGVVGHPAFTSPGHDITIRAIRQRHQLAQLDLLPDLGGAAAKCPSEGGVDGVLTDFSENRWRWEMRMNGAGLHIAAHGFESGHVAS